MLPIGSIAPDFTADTTEGRIRFYDWLDGKWAILFSHPKNFTPVCTTELAALARLQPEFAARDCKLMGVSIDALAEHERWAFDIERTQGVAIDYPLIGDTKLQVAKLYGMLPADTEGSSEGRTAAHNATVRTVFIIGPDKRVKLTLAYPMSTGRNFPEILRSLDSLQLTSSHEVATPADWQPGQDVIIAASVTDEQARRTYPNGFNAVTPYLRLVPQPR